MNKRYFSIEISYKQLYCVISETTIYLSSEKFPCKKDIISNFLLLGYYKHMILTQDPEIISITEIGDKEFEESTSLKYVKSIEL